jgi:hypothetical protein
MKLDAGVRKDGTPLCMRLRIEVISRCPRVNATCHSLTLSVVLT